MSLSQFSSQGSRIFGKGTGKNLRDRDEIWPKQTVSSRHYRVNAFRKSQTPVQQELIYIKFDNIPAKRRESMHKVSPSQQGCDRLWWIYTSRNDQRINKFVKMNNKIKTLWGQGGLPFSLLVRLSIVQSPWNSGKKLHTKTKSRATL